MSRKIFGIMEVMLEGLFSGKCDSCHYWKCCTAQREPKTEWVGQDLRVIEKIPLCPFFDWLRKVVRSEPIPGHFNVRDKVDH